MLLEDEQPIPRHYLSSDDLFEETIEMSADKRNDRGRIMTKENSEAHQNLEGLMEARFSFGR